MGPSNNPLYLWFCLVWLLDGLGRDGISPLRVHARVRGKTITVPAAGVAILGGGRDTRLGART